MQSTWAASSETWGTTHIWANDTYVHNATVAGTLDTTDNATLSIPVAADIMQTFFSELHEEDRVSLLDGTIAAALGVSSSCTLAVPVNSSFSMSNTATGIGGFTFVGNATLSSDMSTDTTQTAVFPATATFSSVLDNVDDEDKVTLISAALESTYGIITGSVLKAVGSGTLGSTVDVINNTNYPEAATIGTDVSTSSASNFLWNTETESSDTWSTSTESTTTWTEQIEDNTTWD